MGNTPEVTPAVSDAVVAAVAAAANAELPGKYEASFEGDFVLHRVFRLVEEVREPANELGVRTPAAAPFIEAGFELGDELLVQAFSPAMDPLHVGTAGFTGGAVAAYLARLVAVPPTVEADVAFWLGSMALHQSFDAGGGFEEAVERLLCHPNPAVVRGALEALARCFVRSAAAGAAVERALKAVWAKHPHLETPQRRGILRFEDPELVLYEVVDGRVARFHRVSTDGTKVYESQGEVGLDGTFEAHPFDQEQSWSQNLERLLVGSRRQGFKELEDRELRRFAIELWSPNPIAPEYSLELAERCQVVYGDLFIERGMGRIQDVRIAGSTLTMYFKVVDFAGAAQLVESVFGLPPVEMVGGEVIFERRRFLQTT